MVDDANVSRRHAEVRPSGGSWVVKDLGSTNGVKVNGRRIQGPQSLKPGDAIELGTSRVDLRAGVAVALDPVSVGAQVRLPGRALPVPALGGALGAEGPAPAAPAPRLRPRPYADATGMHVASAGLGGDDARGAPRLRVETAAGLRAGAAYDLAERRRCWGAAIRRHPARGHVRVRAARADGAAGGGDGDRGSRLDQRHVPQRGAAARSPAPARRRPHPHRRHRASPSRR